MAGLLLWLGGALVHADARAAFTSALAKMEVARTEQAVLDAYQEGAMGVAGAAAAEYMPALKLARERAWERVALPDGIRVTHVGVKPGKTGQGKAVPIRVFGFEVTGAYPVKEVWGTVIWFDTKGNALQEMKDACLFAAASDEEAVAPGKSAMKERDMFLASPGSTPNSADGGVQAVVTVTRVVHVQK